MQCIRVGLWLHQKTDLSVPDTTTHRWLSPSHKYFVNIELLSIQAKAVHIDQR